MTDGNVKCSARAIGCSITGYPELDVRVLVSVLVLIINIRVCCICFRKLQIFMNQDL